MRRLCIIGTRSRSDACDITVSIMSYTAAVCGIGAICVLYQKYTLNATERNSAGSEQHDALNRHVQNTMQVTCAI